jgi:tRNA pseudouridine38-40 synthase
MAGELHRAVKAVSGREPGELYGSGRTDAGVHALHQVAHLDPRDAAHPRPAPLAHQRGAARRHQPARPGARAAALPRPPRRGRTQLPLPDRATGGRPLAKPFVWWVKDGLDAAAMAAACAGVSRGLHDFPGLHRSGPGGRIDEGEGRIRRDPRRGRASSSSASSARISSGRWSGGWSVVLAEVGRGALDESDIAHFLSGPLRSGRAPQPRRPPACSSSACCTKATPRPDRCARCCRCSRRGPAASPFGPGP